MTGWNDFMVVDEGSLVGITAKKDAVREWLESNTQCEGWQWLGDTLWIDRRYARAIVEGLMEEGFSS